MSDAGGVSGSLADAGFTAGSRIAGYLLEEPIGRGGMAVVFRARDERLQRLVALKVLAPALAGDEEFRQRFIRESRAAAAVDDPHIIPVFEAGEAHGVLFIAMRFVPGGDIRTLLHRSGPFAAVRAAAVISPVASALDAAHAAGLVHRDVKPANMLVDARSGRPDHVYLSDFGLTKKTLATSAGLTATGKFMGTLEYVSPEQIAGKKVDGRADQYALACSAFELLTGAPPFTSDEATAVLFAQMSDPPPPLTTRRPDLPRAADQVFARALAKSPQDRYPSCRDFADALRGAFGLAPYDSGPVAVAITEHSRTQLAGPASPAEASPAWSPSPAEPPSPAWPPSPAEASPAWSPSPAEPPSPAWSPSPAEASPAWSPSPAEPPSPAWSPSPAEASPAWSPSPAEPSAAWSPSPAGPPSPAWPPPSSAEAPTAQAPIPGAPPPGPGLPPTGPGMPPPGPAGPRPARSRRRPLFIALAAIAVLAVAAVATILLVPRPAPSHHPLVHFGLTADSSIQSVDGYVLVEYLGGSDASARLSGEIKGVRHGEVVKLYAQPFPYTRKPAVASSAVLQPVGRLANYAFTVTPSLATRYTVKLFADGSATASAGTSPTRTVYVETFSTFSKPESCSTAACHLSFQIHEIVPPSALQAEITKPWNFYFGLALDPNKEPPPPSVLQLGAGSPQIGTPVRLSATEFEVTISFSFQSGNDAATWSYNACTADSETQDGLGLPGHHGCGDPHIPHSPPYLG